MPWGSRQPGSSSPVGFAAGSVGKRNGPPPSWETLQVRRAEVLQWETNEVIADWAATAETTPRICLKAMRLRISRAQKRGPTGCRPPVSCCVLNDRARSERRHGPIILLNTRQGRGVSGLHPGRRR